MFSEPGEWYFRLRGALFDPANRSAFESASVVCLAATIDTLLSRLEGADDRSLLGGTSSRARLEMLVTARQAGYAKMEHHVNTNGKTVDQVAQRVIALFHAAQQ